MGDVLVGTFASSSSRYSSTASLRLPRASSTFLPWLAMSNSGHQATCSFPSFQSIAEKVRVSLTYGASRKYSRITPKIVFALVTYFTLVYPFSEQSWMFALQPVSYVLLFCQYLIAFSKLMPDISTPAFFSVFSILPSVLYRWTLNTLLFVGKCWTEFFNGAIQCELCHVSTVIHDAPCAVKDQPQNRCNVGIHLFTRN